MRLTILISLKVGKATGPDGLSYSIRSGSANELSIPVYTGLYSVYIHFYSVYIISVLFRSIPSLGMVGETC